MRAQPFRFRLPAGLDRLEATAAAGLALAGAGVAITVDALVAAAQAHPAAAQTSWPARLVLGLWAFRLEHTLVFTIGAGVLVYALRRGARVRGWAVPAARLVGGLAVGLLLVAAAVAVGSTYMALAGHVGALGYRPSGRERVFTWLLQVVTAAGAAAVWALLAGALTDLADARSAPEAAEEAPPDEPEEAPLSVPPPLPPPAPAPVPPEPAPAAVRPAAVAPAPPPPPDDGTLAGRSERLYRERLAFSPRRLEARRLLDRIGELERRGRADEASALAAELERL